MLGVPPGSPKALALLEGCRRFWEGLAAAADHNDDGQVTFEEYAAFSHAPAWFAQHGEPYVTALSAVLDLDDNGLIERDHFLGFHSVAGFPLPYTTKLFDQLNIDGRGRARTDRFADFVRSFYTTGDDLL
ncbi:hypothetical protein GCM10009850_122110 [Nonomuraea monospora]|uniref:Calcium binding protein n=1 Tax=Nonomuraea monospora TaxID=568818 RepID=A0ABN3D568_9ACTN